MTDGSNTVRLKSCPAFVPIITRGRSHERSLFFCGILYKPLFGGISLYAVEVYKKLGFVPIADVQEDGGIQYIPMSYCCYSMDKDYNRRGIIK